MSWEELFNRGGDDGTSVEAIRERLTRRREGDD